MHRVRQSLPYFRELGWEPVVVVVDPIYVEQGQDPLLLDTVPEDVEIIKVKAFSTRWTRKLGLGSLALRSLWFYYREVSRLLKKREFDLVYFSTTMFPLPVLGRIWKRKFGIPYVIDMQDPWHTDYYLNKPKEERPPKYWFVYPLGKYSERFAMQQVDGIIAVSDAYSQTLQSRYPNITSDKCMTLTFGAFEKDFEVLEKDAITNPFFDPADGLIHIPYIGRAGHDMRFALSCIFEALKRGLHTDPALFSKVRLYYIGTSYAAEGRGVKTVEPVAREYGVEKQVTESTNRISYFQALRLLKDASMLLIPGSDDPQYTASKLYNYILAKKPLLAVFHEKSSVVKILQETKAGKVMAFDGQSSLESLSENLLSTWINMLDDKTDIITTDWHNFQKYTAEEMTYQQTQFFHKILQN
jgi:glycosyltransferase involved in cell wall biosynthesis